MKLTADPCIQFNGQRKVFIHVVFSLQEHIKWNKSIAYINDCLKIGEG